MIDGVKCGPDGVRADVDGNLWCSAMPAAAWLRGVTVWTPQGKLIWRIDCPDLRQRCVGPEANRLSLRRSSRSTV